MFQQDQHSIPTNKNGPATDLDCNPFVWIDPKCRLVHFWIDPKCRFVHVWIDDSRAAAGCKELAQVCRPGREQSCGVPIDTLRGKLIRSAHNCLRVYRLTRMLIRIFSDSVAKSFIRFGPDDYLSSSSESSNAYLMDNAFVQSLTPLVILSFHFSSRGRERDKSCYNKPCDL